MTVREQLLLFLVEVLGILLAAVLITTLFIGGMLFWQYEQCRIESEELNLVWIWTWDSGCQQVVNGLWEVR